MKQRGAGDVFCAFRVRMGTGCVQDGNEVKSAGTGTTGINHGIHPNSTTDALAVSVSNMMTVHSSFTHVLLLLLLVSSSVYLTYFSRNYSSFGKCQSMELVVSV